MQVGHKVVSSHHEFKEFPADFSWLQRTEAITDLRGYSGKFFQEVKQSFGLLQIQTIMPHMNTGDNNFFVPFFCIENGLVQYLLLCKASAAAPGIGDNTVGTEIVAPVLNF